MPAAWVSNPSGQLLRDQVRSTHRRMTPSLPQRRKASLATQDRLHPHGTRNASHETASGVGPGALDTVSKIGRQKACSSSKPCLTPRYWPSIISCMHDLGTSSPPFPLGHVNWYSHSLSLLRSSLAAGGSSPAPC